ncbi:MAG: hypothetical protein U0324_40735 [Polyangiales bacterium]
MTEPHATMPLPPHRGDGARDRLAPPAAPRFAFASADAELFCEPSGEALRLLRWLGPLTTPTDGRGPLPLRALRHALVAPFTQLTLVSFDLQMFLFDVFHTSVGARVGHFVGMAGVNLFAMAIAARAAGSPWGGVAYAAVLLAWYAAVAHSRRLWLWWAATVPLVGALLAGAAWLSARDGRTLALGFAASGAVISFSHLFEPRLPPRVGDPFRWTTPRTYVLGPLGERGAAATAARALFLGSYVVLGWLNELWAAPRLLPYNLLRLLMAAGYAPALRAVLDERARRAWASGNPALDYVGIGGGTFLAPPGGS